MGMSNWYAGAGLAATLFLAGCAGTTPQSLQEDGYSKLTGDEIRALHAGGVETQWRTPNNIRGRTVYEPDGSATAYGPAEEFPGEWRVQRDRLCTRYDGINNGEERCQVLYGDGSGSVELFRDGEHVASVTYP